MGILIVAAGLVCAALGIFAVAGAVYFVLMRGKGPERRRSGGGSSSDASSDSHFMSGVPFAFDSTDTGYESALESAGDGPTESASEPGSSDSFGDSGSSDSGSSDSGSSDSGSSGSSSWSE